MKIQTAKGVRDISPEEKILKNKVVDTLRKYFEKYGYNPLDTPVIERFDVLASKYAGGSEILKETFKLTDQGERELCLRYDLTVPLARYVAMNPTLKLPFKRYQVGQVFRDGPIKLGRFREFTQCDADVIGIKEVYAEAEQIKMACEAFKELGLNVVVNYNNRKLLDLIMKTAKVPEEKTEEAILILDKKKKLAKEELIKEFEKKGIITPEKILELSSKDLESLKKILGENEAITELEQLKQYLNEFETQATFDPSLARGLSYYTGTVFELFLKDSKIKSSIGAGGRYDKMIGNFLQNNQEYPAVGISFGLDVILESIKLQEKQEQKTVVKAYIIPIGTKNESIKILNELRQNNISADMNITKKGISKALDYASAYNIPYCIIIGEDEIKQKKYTLKNMKTGEEKLLSIKEITTILN